MKTLPYEELFYQFNITFVLDDSYSIADYNYTEDVIAGFDHFLDEIQKHPQIRDSRLQLHFLNQTRLNTVLVTPHMHGVTLKSLGYRPVGNTPLYDCMGRALLEAENYRKKMDTKYGFICKNIFIVLTDGEDNTSNDFSRDDILAIMDRLRKNGYSFFIGLNINNENTKFFTDLGFSVVNHVTINQVFNDLFPRLCGDMNIQETVLCLPA
jgi:hypothetical protein